MMLLRFSRWLREFLRQQDLLGGEFSKSQPVHQLPMGPSMAGLLVQPLKAYGIPLVLLRIGVWCQKLLPCDSVVTMCWHSIVKANRDLLAFLRCVHGLHWASRNSSKVVNATAYSWPCSPLVIKLWRKRLPVVQV